MNENNQDPKLAEMVANVPSASPDEASKRSFAHTTKPDAAAAEEPKAEDAAAADSKGSEVGGKKSNTKAAAATELEDGTVVFMSKMVFESFERKSSSVAAVQTRLVELGYLSAGDDKRGWLSTGTKEALASFATDNRMKADNFLDEKVMKALFANTKVTLLP